MLKNERYPAPSCSTPGLGGFGPRYRHKLRSGRRPTFPALIESYLTSKQPAKQAIKINNRISCDTTFGEGPFTPCTLPYSLLEALAEASKNGLKAKQFCSRRPVPGSTKFDTYQEKPRFLSNLETISWGARNGTPHMQSTFVEKLK